MGGPPAASGRAGVSAPPVRAPQDIVGLVRRVDLDAVGKSEFDNKGDLSSLNLAFTASVRAGYAGLVTAGLGDLVLRRTEKRDRRGWEWL